MTNSVSQAASWFAGNPQPKTGRAVQTTLAVWLGIVLLLGANGIYAGAPGRPPLAVFGGAVLPLLAFAVAIRASRTFREYLLAIDLRLIVGMQAWRYAGIGFIALYANHVLPGLFAWPAGLGDMAIGIVAPWWIVALSKNPETAANFRFRLWNTLGIFDFVIAFTTATICAMTIPSDVSPGIAPMGQLPLVLIPAFMVPLFAMLHVVALMQSKRMSLLPGRTADSDR